MIKTNKCFLRPANIEDAELIANFYRDNEAHLASWNPIAPEGFYTKSYWQEKIKTFDAERESGRSLRFCLINANDELMGMVNFNALERGPFQNCRVGYLIGKKFEGQGYMKEALKAAFDHMFSELNFHRIEANYIPRNERSGKLLESLGFTKIGIAPNYLQIAGVWEDHIQTQLINSNWQSNK